MVNFVHMQNMLAGLIGKVEEVNKKLDLLLDKKKVKPKDNK